MLDFLAKTPEWLQPLQSKLFYLNESNPNLLWNGIKNMTYSFIVTLVIKGDAVKGLKSAGIAACAELVLTQAKFLALVSQEIGWSIPPVIRNYGFRMSSFGIVCYVNKETVDVKASAIATIIPLILAKGLKAPGLNMFGIIRV